MSTLQDRLDRIRAGFLQQAPAEVKEVFGRSLEALRASGITGRLPRPGDPLPAFDLLDTEGGSQRSAELLLRGPLVISCYRGIW